MTENTRVRPTDYPERPPLDLYLKRLEIQLDDPKALRSTPTLRTNPVLDRSRADYGADPASGLLRTARCSLRADVKAQCHAS